MKREDAMQMIEDGIANLNSALRAGRSDTLQRFLATLARFHNYSFGNALLIALQRPDATHVAGFHTWRKLGRFVKKGESGIGILAPMVSRKKADDGRSSIDQDGSPIFGFKVAYVFDFNQTEGKDLPEFASVIGEPGEWLELLEQSIRDSGVELEYDYLPRGALGRSIKGQIVVRPDLSPSERFAVLAHELAHELLHQRSERRSETTKQIRETEAEAVAYTVCLACGIDSTIRSADYIQLYQGNEGTLKESLGFVQQAASEILSDLRKRRDGLLTAAELALSA
jgi:hypothetical protein